MTNTNEDREQQLDKELRIPPMGKDPFGDRRLAERILQRIDEEESGLVRRRPPFGRWAAALGGAVAVMLAFVLVWQAGWSWPGMGGESERSAAAPSADDWSAGVNSLTDKEDGQPVATALLLGLKMSDGEEVGYRTLLLVSDGRGKIELSAQQEGIIAPYGMEFWRLDTAVRNEKDGEVKVIEAAPIATKKQKDAVYALSSEFKKYEEELMFVGNRYASLQIESERQQNGVEARTETVRVSDFALLQNSSVLNLPVESEEIRYLTPAQLTSEIRTEAAAVSPTPAPVPSWVSGSYADTYDWGVMRNPGRWSARLAQIGAIGGTSNGSSYTWLGEAWELPDEVVAHDKLCCGWNSIMSLYPRTSDAVSSPAGDWIAMITPDQLVAHAVRNGVPDRQAAIKLPLESRESLVMAQWAVGSYVDKWSKELQK